MELMDLPPIGAPQNLKLGDIEVTLANEMVQKVNDRLELSFMTTEAIEKVLANLDKKEAIIYNEETYTEYTVLVEFGFKIGLDDKKVYRAILAKPEISPAVAKAIEVARIKATDTDVIQMAELLNKFEDFVGKSMAKGTRFTYDGIVYKAVNAVDVVETEKLPPENTDYKRLG